ncbi:organomercurial lyase MerB [Tsukamurella sp. M9C]|uniref:organomercurial lyase MerB n=1 Tax=Tsukamurella sp. M9C TaxID=2877520 RepID=UPI0021061CB5|nr:organomercurial lyase MerB [Tsukamurella sp. M9C]
MTNPLDRLITPEGSGLDPAVLVPLLRLLSKGNPVSVEDLAAAAGLSEPDVRERLQSVADTEYDDRDQIVGQGLTLRPTPHRFTVAGHELFTWCALDTLIFPTLLNQSATIESTSPASGQTIRISVTADTVTSIEPDTAVLSLVDPDDLSSLRTSFCNQVHFFASPHDAQTWTRENPGNQLLDITHAHALGKALAEQALISPDTARQAGCCSPDQHEGTAQ